MNIQRLVEGGQINNNEEKQQKQQQQMYPQFLAGGVALRKYLNEHFLLLFGQMF